MYLHVALSRRQEGSCGSANHAEDLQNPGIHEDVICWLCDFQPQNIPCFPTTSYDFANDALILNTVCETRDKEKCSRYFNLLMLQL